jgi:O-methyltransferase
VDAKHLYIDLVKLCVLNAIYGDILEPFFNPRLREVGKDWPELAHSMVGFQRLNNIQMCVEDVLKRDIKGDLIEAGVWRGGASIFMTAILKAYSVTDRRVFVADSFDGLPIPNAEKYPKDAESVLYKTRGLAVSMEEVQSNFRRYGILDEQVCFLKGWFKDTLPTVPSSQLAVIRLDGDMYESTMDGFVNLYPKLSVGGYLIVDDYGALESCKAAVDDYRRDHKITDEIVVIDWTGVYWKRTS